MKRFLLHWFAPVLLAAAGWLPAAPAQQLPPPSAAPAPAESEKSERPPPALQYAVAVLFTLAVLLVVCMPSRKGY